MTDFFGQKILSDDGNQDLTVPEYMKAFIDSLTEAKHAPVTLAEYMQAVVNKMTAYPELWKKGIND